MYEGPDNEGRGRIVINYNFPDSVDWTQRRVSRLVITPAFSSSDGFRPTEPSGTWIIPWDLSCSVPGTHTFRAYAESCSLPEVMDEQVVQHAAEPTVGIVYNGPDANGHGTVSINYSFPKTSSPDQRELIFAVPTLGYSTRLAAPTEQAGTTTFDWPLTCKPSATHRFIAEARHCNGRVATAETTAVVNGKPDVSISVSPPDNNSDVRVAIDYRFPNTDSWDDRLVVRSITGPGYISNEGIRPTEREGRWEFIWNTACWPPGTYPFKAYAEACNGETDSDETQSVVVPTAPTVSLSLSAPDSSGNVTGTVNYDFSHTTPSSNRRLWRVIRGNGWTDTGDVFVPPTPTGVWTFTYNVACKPQEPITFTVYARACSDDRTGSDEETLTPNHRPEVSLRLEGTVSPVAVLTYAFSGTGSHLQRTLRLERADGSLISEWHPTTMNGEERVTITACEASGGVKAVAIACSDERVEDEAELTQREPTVDVTLLRVERDPQTGRRKILGEVTYDMREGTTNWKLEASPLSWVDADGTTHTGGEIFWRYEPTTATGTISFTFVPPSGAQQVTVRMVARSCAGSTTDTGFIACPDCDATGNPVYPTDGNMRLYDSDPLPPINSRSLSRTYNSDEQVVALFGRGWTTLFDRRLIVNTIEGEQFVSIVTESNQVVTFRAVGSSYMQTWPKARRKQDALTRDAAAGVYVYRAAGSNEVAVFASNGRLLALRDLGSGREAQIAYNAQGLPHTLTDSWSGLSWTLAYVSGQRRVASVAISGRPDLTWSYSYDPGGNLTTVSAPGGGTWRTYQYNAANRMTASYDALGNLIESHSYDENGYATNSTGDIDEIAKIEYNLPGSNASERITRITHRSGAVVDYVLRAAGGAYRAVQVKGGCQSCGKRDVTMVYDERGRIIREQSADGYVDVMTYDGEHLVAQQHYMVPAGCDPEVAADRCRLDFDALRDAELETTTSSITTSYAYDDARWPERVTSVTTPSIVDSSLSRTTVMEYHPTSGSVSRMLTSGFTASERGDKRTTTQVHRRVSTTFYGDVPREGGDDPVDSLAPAFEPGGAFQSTWISLPQPALLPKFIDGPRSDAGDVTSLVYYPIHASVPFELRGRLAATRNAAGHVTRFEGYDVFGNVTRTVDPNGVATEMTYDLLGRIKATTVKGVAGCDTSKDALCATDLTATSTYSPLAGPLQSEQRPGGGATVYTYDARGRVATISRGASPSSGDLRERIAYEYDANTGKKSLETILAFENGTWVEKKREAFSYDAHGQLQTLTHADGATIAYQYDAEGRLASAKDENHTTPNTFYSYDPAGRLTTVRQTLAGFAANEISTRYAYDIHGNLIATTDPNGNVTRYTFDDFGSVIAQESPVTGITVYSYDDAGNLISSTDANSAITERRYDSLNRIVRSISTRDGAAEEVTWTYDDPAGERYAVGRLATMSDPAGTTNYHYERRGLLREESRAFTTAPQPPSDGDGRALSARPSGDDRTPTATTVTRYAYDRDGNRSMVRYPSGELAVNYTFDFAGRPLTASGIVTSAAYLPFGPVTRIRLTNGTTQTMQYDTRYRMTKNELSIDGVQGNPGLIAGYGYSYDSAGNVTKIGDAANNDYARHFEYDDLNRLVKATTRSDTQGNPSPLWGRGEYAWDAMGNILKASLAEVEPGGGPELLATNPKKFKPRDKPKQPGIEAIVQPLGRVMTFSYKPTDEGTTTPILTAVTLNDLSRTVTHDDAGNETKYVVSRAYSPRNLLATVTDEFELPTDVHTLAYGYDGRGVRVIRAESPSNGAGTTARRYYTYSPELRLLSATRDNGPNVWGGKPPSPLANNVDYEVVWFGDRPIAQIEPNVPADRPGCTRASDGSCRLYTFADQLGTPLLQMDGNLRITVQNVVEATRWRVEYEPFGGVYEVRAGTRTDQPLRFPGQEVAMTWEGPEENYNIFRWYKGAWGRYTQLDSLTGDTGVKSYGYADANPAARIDPLGLRSYATDYFPRASAATIVCRNGRVVPFIGNSYFRDAHERRCLYDCTYMHEQSHANDAEISDQNVCRRKRNGVVVAWDNEREQYASERRAYLVSIRCLQWLQQRCSDCAELAQRFIDFITNLLMNGNITGNPYDAIRP